MTSEVQHTPKLSEAIRIGSKLRPQAFGDLFKGGGSCVIGAAIEGATGKTQGSYSAARRLFPILRQKVMHPIYRAPYDLQGVLIDLNDMEMRCRERIADFVESIESEASK